MRIVRYEITIAAPAERVYRHLTEAEGLTRWMAVEAIAEARPGGELWWRHENGAEMRGRFVELDPPRRVVFTYGWVDGAMGVSAGTTLVEIDIKEIGDTTRLRVTHRDLPDESADPHKEGWAYFFGILRRRLEEI